MRGIISYVILIAFITNCFVTPACAQVLGGSVTDLSPAFHPPVLTGLKVYVDNPLKFDFILDQGDGVGTSLASRSGGSATSLENEANRLIKYFLAGLTIPEGDLWVNLSPYEKDRVVPEAFGQTEMGRDILAQDYLLKQMMASLLYPEGTTGKKFWSDMYRKMHEKYGTSDIPVDTFNKVWIMPALAEVYENSKAGVGYVVKSRLKVMLESDYLAMKNNAVDAGRVGSAIHETVTQELSKDLIRSIILPVLEKEINEGQHFAQLRQVYQSLILATWYKRKMKESLLSKVYVDRKKTAGVDIADKQAAEKIWAEYVETFKKGAHSLIRDEQDPVSGDMIPRKYISGGVRWDMSMLSINSNVRGIPENPGLMDISIELVASSWGRDSAMDVQSDNPQEKHPLFSPDGKKLNVVTLQRLLVELSKTLSQQYQQDVRLFVGGSAWDYKNAEGWTQLSDIEDLDIEVMEINAPHKQDVRLLGRDDRFKIDLRNAFKGIFSQSGFSFEYHHHLWEEYAINWFADSLAIDGNKKTVQFVHSSIDYDPYLHLGLMELKGYWIVERSLFVEPTDAPEMGYLVSKMGGAAASKFFPEPIPDHKIVRRYLQIEESLGALLGVDPDGLYERITSILRAASSEALGDVEKLLANEIRASRRILRIKELLSVLVNREDPNKYPDLEQFFLTDPEIRNLARYIGGIRHEKDARMGLASQLNGDESLAGLQGVAALSMDGYFTWLKQRFGKTVYNHELAPFHTERCLEYVYYHGREGYLQKLKDYMDRNGYESLYIDPSVSQGMLNVWVFSEFSYDRVSVSRVDGKTLNLLLADAAESSETDELFDRGLARDMSVRNRYQFILYLLSLPLKNTERKDILIRFLEPYVFSHPEELSVAVLNSLLVQYRDDVDIRYFLYYISVSRRAMMEVRNLAREYIKSNKLFKLHQDVADHIKIGKKKVLLVHNINHLMGDELVRMAILIQGFLDFNPEIEVTVITGRPFLYDNARVRTVAMADIEKSGWDWEGFKEKYDVVVDNFNVHLGYSNELEKRVQMSGVSDGAYIHVRSTTFNTAYSFDEVNVAGEQYADRFGLNHGRADNVYETSFRLAAEFGLPLRTGEGSRGDSLINGLSYLPAEVKWNEMMRQVGNEQHDGQYKYPVVFFNPYGGDEEGKGFDRTASEQVALIQTLKEIVKQGYKVVIFPNGTFWGDREAAVNLLSALPEDVRRSCVVADEPSVDPKAVKYYVGYADYVLTVEGGMVHLAFIMEKSFGVILKSGAGSREWIPFARNSMQRVVENVGDALRIYQEKNIEHTGGIDLNLVNNALKVNASEGGVQFNLDSAMVQKYQFVLGFAPVIRNIKPLESLSGFLKVPSIP